jgi:hypothetical protein
MNLSQYNTFQLQAGWTGHNSRQWFFFSPQSPDWCWSLIQPPTEWVLGTLSLWVKWSEHETDHSPPSTVWALNQVSAPFSCSNYIWQHGTHNKAHIQKCVVLPFDAPFFSSTPILLFKLSHLLTWHHCSFQIFSSRNKIHWYPLLTLQCQD